MPKQILSSAQRKHLKKAAHHLNPLISIGKNSLSEALLKEFNNVIECHELVKAKVNTDDRSEFLEVCKKIEDLSEAILVDTIGRIGIFYKPSKTPKIILPS